MFPFIWGPNMSGEPYSGAAAFAMLNQRRFLDDGLPEEVREAIENNKDRIYSEEDIRKIAEDSWLKR